MNLATLELGWGAARMAAKVLWPVVRPVLFRVGKRGRDKFAADIKAGRVLSWKEYGEAVDA